MSAAALPEASSQMPMREVIARSVYRQLPFRSFSPDGREFPWEAAPAFYRSKCLSLADGLLADLLIAQNAERFR